MTELSPLAAALMWDEHVLEGERAVKWPGRSAVGCDIRIVTVTARRCQSAKTAKSRCAAIMLRGVINAPISPPRRSKMAG